MFCVFLRKEWITACVDAQLGVGIRVRHVAFLPFFSTDIRPYGKAAGLHRRHPGKIGGEIEEYIAFLTTVEQNALGKNDSTFASLGIHRLYHVLQPCIVGIRVCRTAPDVPSIRIVRKHRCPPLRKTERRVRNHAVEGLELSGFCKAGISQCVALFNIKLLCTVKEEVHPCNGCS